MPAKAYLRAVALLAARLDAGRMAIYFRSMTDWGNRPIF